MSQFIQSFDQYLDERKRHKDDEEHERGRHRVAKDREQKIHNRLMSVGGKEGEEAEKTRHRAAKKALHQRHVADPKSKYIHSGKRTSTDEAVGNVPGIVSAEPFHTTSRRSKNRSPNAPPTSDLLMKAHGRIAKEKRLRREKEARGKKIAKVIAPNVDLDAPTPKKKPSLVSRVRTKLKKSREAHTANMHRALKAQHNEYIPNNQGENMAEAAKKTKNLKKGKEYAIQQTDTRTGKSKLLDPKKPVKSDLARMMARHDKEDVDEAARDKATHIEYKKIMTGQLNQIRKIQRLTKKAQAAKKSESEVKIVPTIPPRKKRPYKRRFGPA